MYLLIKKWYNDESKAKNKIKKIRNARGLKRDKVKSSKTKIKQRRKETQRSATERKKKTIVGISILCSAFIHMLHIGVYIDIFIYRCTARLQQQLMVSVHVFTVCKGNTMIMMTMTMMVMMTTKNRNIIHKLLLLLLSFFWVFREKKYKCFFSAAAMPFQHQHNFSLLLWCYFKILQSLNAHIHLVFILRLLLSLLLLLLIMITDINIIINFHMRISVRLHRFFHVAIVAVDVVCFYVAIITFAAMMMLNQREEEKKNELYNIPVSGGGLT